MKAILKNYRQSPRKIRLITSAIKGKRVDVANLELSFLIKRGALPIQKLLQSAIANARNFGIETENLIVKDARVDKGVVLKRQMPRARGSAFRINKRSSHITIILGEAPAPKKKGGKVEKKEEAKKVPVKVATKKPKKTKV